MSRITRDEAAAGTTTSFIVGLAIFVLAFAVVIVFVSINVQREASSAGEDVDLNQRALASLRTLTGTPGIPQDWHARVPQDDPTLFGLLKPGTETTLDVEKFRALNNELNSKDWYESDAKALLGLEGYDFHVRAHPNLKKDANGKLPDFALYRAAYVGRHTGSHPTYTADAPTSGIDGPLLASVGVDYSDDLADYAGPASGAFGGGDRFASTPESLTRLLALRLAGFPYATDHDGSLANESYWKVVSLDDAPNRPGTTPVIPNDASRPEFVLTASNREFSGGSEKWTYSKGDVATPSVDRLVVGLFDFSDASSGAAWLNLTHHVRGKQDAVLTLRDVARVRYWCASGCTSTEWTAVANAEWTVEPANYDPADPTTFWTQRSVPLTELLGKKAWIALSWEAGGSSDVREGWFVKNVTVEASARGERRTLYENDIDYETSLYDVLVVGSSVDQSPFEDAATGYVWKHAVTNWVKAGGDLVALGSDSLDNRWLAPTFTEGGTVGAAGQLFADVSDLTHPTLTAPNTLRYQAYTPYPARSYDTSDIFTKVLLGENEVLKDGVLQRIPLLAASNANPDWRGTVVLTNYAPPGIPASGTERFDFMTNMLAYTRFDVLYLDWGGTIPASTAVGSASRTMLVDASAYNLGTKEAFVVMYVWR